MSGDAGEPTQPLRHGGKRGWTERMVRPSTAAAVFCYLVIAIAGLIILRAIIDQLDFIGIGWLIALALIPLLPWALPRLGGFIETISRYVSRVGVGGWVQIDLRNVTDTAIVVPTSGGAN